MTVKEAEKIVMKAWDPFRKTKIDNNRWELAKLTILEAIGSGRYRLVTGTNVPDQPSVPPMPETEEEKNRRLCRENYAAQMDPLGYNADGNRK